VIEGVFYRLPAASGILTSAKPGPGHAQTPAALYNVRMTTTDTSAAGTAPGIVRLDQFRFHHVLEETPGLALVFFTGPYCGACKVLRRVLADYLTTRPVAVYEVDAERDLALAREFGVFHLPSMFLYQDGLFHCELHSEPRAPALDAAIAAARARPAEEAP